MKMTIHSPAFADQSRIPRDFTADGNDVSPALAWTDIPVDTQEFAIICDDPDAPSPEPWVHWLIYKIPGHVRELPSGLPNIGQLEFPSGTYQGRNSWHAGKIVGYRGPAPPRGNGIHHYHFKLYALDRRLELEPGVEKKVLMAAMESHIISKAELIGTYER